MPSPTGQDSPEDLLRAVARGDRRAFERLYRQTSGQLYAVCLRVLGPGQDAEEVLQDVFLTVWRKAGQFDAARAGARPWLNALARNRCIDRLRQQGNAPVTVDMEWAEVVPDPAPAIFEQVAEREVHHGLEACLAELEESRRELLRTAFFEGVTYEDLALRTGHPIGTVKSWIRRSLARLRTCLTAAGHTGMAEH